MSQLNLVAIFSPDPSAGIHGGVEEINLSFSQHEPDPTDIEQLTNFLREYFDADRVITLNEYNKEVNKQNEYYQKMEEEAGL